MSVDFAGLLDAPAYATFGVTAAITPNGGVAVSLTVLDKVVEVIETGASGVEIPTLKPAADLRLEEMATVGLTREDLTKAEIVFGGVTYKVEATMPVANTRELRLILSEVV